MTRELPPNARPCAADQTSLSVALDCLADLADLVGRGTYPATGTPAEIARTLEPLVFIAGRLNCLLGVTTAQTTRALDQTELGSPAAALNNALGHLTHAGEAMKTVLKQLESGVKAMNRAAGNKPNTCRSARLPAPPIWSSVF
ncbi:hypothetical protein AB0C84_40130 [Actinomadura sp. NPDC048955]|uniref:hypothetical protein n=1 Tax=Actinomadura sp. NPDC048955 TaxID=3158228 RepID=UPI0033C84237